jgi:BirA family biotin operon repressor/biotin-[acetyl-CoA-carboxylase] ligase
MKNKADILWLESAESSNDEARKAIDSLDNLSVVAVRCQTSGRGQGTHSWESAPGENLTFSVVLKDFDISPKEQIAISQITALSVVDLLSRYEVAAKIKLPNDIYVGTKKICGILIENSLCGNNLRWSIVGIGININQTVFPSHLPNPTSLLLEMPVGQNPVQSTPQVQHLELNKLLTQFHEIYSRYYDCYISHNTDLDSTDLGNTHESKLEALDQLFRSKLL